MQELVPVQLNLGSSRGTTQEWLLWPAGATDEVPEFAASLVADLGARPQFCRSVADSILSQLADWGASVPPPPPPGQEPRRELIKLDLVLGGGLRLRDQFVWDLHAASPTPEEFAAELCADCGLDACNGAAVAAAIRLELGKLRRKPPSSLPLPTPRILEGRPAAAAPAAVVGTDAGSWRAVPLESVYGSSHCTRSQEEWQEWGPSLHQLSAEETRALQRERQLAAERAQQALQQRIQQQQAAAAQQQALAQRAARLASAQQQALAAQGDAAGGPEPQQPAAQQPPAEQQQELQQQEQQQQQSKAAPKKRGRGEGEAAAPRRMLRPRRASRLAALLLKEDDDDDEDSSSEEGSREGSRNSAGPGAAAAGAGAHHRAVGGASAGSGDYQPDEESLRQEDEELEATHRKSAERRPAAARSRAPRGKKAAAAAQPPVKPAPQRRQRQQAQQQEQQEQQQQQQQQVASPPHQRQVASPRPGLAAYQQGAVPPAVVVQQLPPGQLANGGSLGVPYGSSRVLGGPAALAGLAPGGPGASLAPAGGSLELPLSAGPQHVQVVSAAIVHYARELGIGEHKIQSFLTRPPGEQISLYRSLQQLVQQHRARQQEQLQAAVLAQQAQLAQQQSMPAQLPPMPLPLPPNEQLAQQPAGPNQYANLFSEMFD